MLYFLDLETSSINENALQDLNHRPSDYELGLELYTPYIYCYFVQ
jgi:hypothetical protein